MTPSLLKSENGCDSIMAFPSILPTKKKKKKKKKKTTIIYQKVTVSIFHKYFYSTPYIRLLILQYIILK